MPKLVNVVLIGMLTMVMIMTAMLIGPVIETRFFPVYSRFDIVEMREVDGGTEVRFSYDKYRSCPAYGFAWYVGEFGATSRQVSVTPTAASQRRDIGEHISPVYLLEASSDQIERGLRAEIYNRCHPFWMTRTEIYP